jgi:hypothetical protein
VDICISASVALIRCSCNNQLSTKLSGHCSPHHAPWLYQRCSLTASLEAANLPSCKSCRAARTARRHILPAPGCRCGTLLAPPPLLELHGVTHVTQRQEATRSSSLQRGRPDQYTRHHDRERRRGEGRVLWSY